MGFLSGNNYRTVIGKETALGSGKTNATSIAWTELTILPDKCEMTHTPTPIETGNKTNTGLPTLCETKAGYNVDTVVLSGVLSHEHEILLQAFFKDSASPYVMDSVPDLDGYVIMQVWSDDVATPYIVDKAVGCQLVSLKLDGASGGLITYEATFTSLGITRRVATESITGADPGTVCTEGFSFGDVVASLNFGDGSHIKSFSLTLNNNAVDDASIYQNSNTRLNTILNTVSGTLNHVTNYNDNAYEKLAETYLFGDTISNEEIYFVNTKKEWHFELCSQPVEYKRADPDKQLFENNVTEKLVFDGTDYPITITVTTI